MKLLALILAMALLGGNVYSNIQVKQGTEVFSQQDKKLIDKEELPEKVVQEFNKSVYKEWTIEKVYLIEAANEVSYELHLTQQDETMVLLADSQGVLQPRADG